MKTVIAIGFVAAWVLSAPPAEAQCELAQLIPSDGGAPAGSAIAIDGDVAVLGVPGHDGSCLGQNETDCGAAYVFRRTGTTWVEEAKLVAPSPQGSARFGWSVAIDGGTIVVGAQDETLCQGCGSVGAIFVFELVNETWEFVQRVPSPVLSAHLHFGHTVAVSGDLIASGTDASAIDTVFTFRRTAQGWLSAEAINPPPSSLEARDFGESLALEDGRMLVGSPLADLPSRNDAGMVFAYRFKFPVWILESTLFSPEPASGEQFGIAVALSGNLALVGVPFTAVGCIPGENCQSGAAHVFERKGQTWTHLQQLQAPQPETNDWFASAVAIDGETIAVGSWRDDVACPQNPNCNSGSVFLFERPTSIWTLTEIITPSVSGAGDQFGQSVANSGNLTLVGSQNQGSAYVFATGNDCNGNDVPDLCDLADGVSLDCNANELPDECELADGTSQDCNENSIPDECDLAFGPSEDCNGNEVPDECETIVEVIAHSAELSPIGDGVPQSFLVELPPEAALDVSVSFTARGDFASASELVTVRLNGVEIGDIFVAGATDCPVDPDQAEILLPPATFNDLVAGGDALFEMLPSAGVDPNPLACTSSIQASLSYRATVAGDCNANGVPDECELASGDCNENGTLDECDIAAGLSQDCQVNGSPDECDIASGTSADCQQDGIPDECELAGHDCNENGIVDECDVVSGSSQDCQSDGTPDECDIASGVSLDCQLNGVPDECELVGLDCNNNAILDECEIADGTSEDCQSNGFPDECDIADGSSQDCQSNGIPDECDGGCPPVFIASSVPPDGEIDARQPTSLDGSVTFGWDSVVLTFDNDASAVIMGDLAVTSSAGVAPTVSGIAIAGTDVTVTLSGPIPAGAWTQITYTPATSSICLGYLPGDANSDGTSSPADILAVIDSLNGILPRPDYATDADRSGTPGPEDILRVIDLLNGAATFDAWLDATIGSACP